jgi:NAD(P)-dependent dehydrogenase (short-subunit alcohol dehydrogenase family)
MSARGIIEDLRGKWVVVTGAASGIGRATALAFAQQGAHLYLSDRDAAGLYAVSEEVRALGVECHFEYVDVSDAESMRAFAAAVELTVGAPHVVVNNAGIGYIGGFADTPLSTWGRILGVNLMGVVHGCLFFLPGMSAAGGPRRIVNIASLAGFTPAPNMSAYAASKFAVIGLSETLALELELQDSQVGLTMVCPGVINTAITRSSGIAPTIDASRIDTLQKYYSARGGSADMVAESIVNAVRSGRELVLVGPFSAMLYHARRISRALLRRMMLADARALDYS